VILQVRQCLPHGRFDSSAISLYLTKEHCPLYGGDSAEALTDGWVAQQMVFGEEDEHYQDTVGCPLSNSYQDLCHRENDNGQN
jgi:hypothetical protein